MDDIVKQALIKWPGVPNCYGWLGLDTRGRWYLRDNATQAAGPFAGILAGTSARSKGSLLQHDKLIAFIERNYESDAQGCWFFQNGPQRVYVELALTPWVWRLQAEDFSVLSHTGRQAVARDCLLDAQGRVYLDTDIGLGLVHTLDVTIAADAVAAGHWTVQQVQAEDLPARHGYILSPADARRVQTGDPA